MCGHRHGMLVMRPWFSSERQLFASSCGVVRVVVAVVDASFLDALSLVVVITRRVAMHRQKLHAFRSPKKTVVASNLSTWRRLPRKAPPFGANRQPPD